MVTENVLFKRGDASVNNAFIGTDGELTINRSGSIHIHDGSRKGGTELLGINPRVIIGEPWPDVETAILLPTDTAVEYDFGLISKLSEDGNMAAIVTINDNAPAMVYIFNLVDGSWTVTTRLKANIEDGNIFFGAAIAISGDGSTILVSSPHDEYQIVASVYVFNLVEGSWINTGRIRTATVNEGEVFGASVSLSRDGTIAVVGSPYDGETEGETGSVRVFNLVGSEWIQTGMLTPSEWSEGDMFGWTVNVSDDGTTILAGMPQEQGHSTAAAYIFNLVAGNWIETTKLVPTTGTSGEMFSWITSLSGDGTTALVGSPYLYDPGTPATYVFSLVGNDWVQVAKLSPSDWSEGEMFGWSVSLSSDGTTVLVGSPMYYGDGKDSTYVYVITDGVWVEVARLLH